VLHVIGATAAAVRAIVVIEGLLIGAVSIVVATLACLPMTAALGDYMGATTAAARRASRLTIREALITL
jgi:hypothetical protein